MPHDPDPFYVALGTRVRDIRRTAHITQAAVAAETGLSRQSVANIEKGRQRFMVHTLLDVARALGVEPATLLPTKETGLSTLDVDRYDLSPKAKRFVLAVLEPKVRP